MDMVLMSEMASAWRPRIHKATAGQMTSAPLGKFWLHNRVHCSSTLGAHAECHQLCAAARRDKCERKLRAERPNGSQPHYQETLALLLIITYDQDNRPRSAALAPLA